MTEVIFAPNASTQAHVVPCSDADAVEQVRLQLRLLRSTTFFLAYFVFAFFLYFMAQFDLRVLFCTATPRIAGREIKRAWMQRIHESFMHRTHLHTYKFGWPQNIKYF